MDEAARSAVRVAVAALVALGWLVLWSLPAAPDVGWKLVLGTAAGMFALTWALWPWATRV